MKRVGVKRSYPVREGYWFVPKLLGYGATPVTWQGWALVLGYGLALTADVRFMPSVAAKIAIGAALTIALTVISYRKTDGGWHWRWGAR